MTELDFYKFIHNNKIEYHELTTDDENNDTFYFFVPFHCVENFHQILGYSFFDDEGHIAILKQDYIVYSAVSVLEYFGIDVADMHKKLSN